MAQELLLEVRVREAREAAEGRRKMRGSSVLNRLTGAGAASAHALHSLGTAGVAATAVHAQKKSTDWEARDSRRSVVNRCTQGALPISSLRRQVSHKAARSAARCARAMMQRQRRARGNSEEQKEVLSEWEEQK